MIWPASGADAQNYALRRAIFRPELGGIRHTESVERVELQLAFGTRE